MDNRILQDDAQYNLPDSFNGVHVFFELDESSDHAGPLNFRYYMVDNRPDHRTIFWLDTYPLKKRKDIDPDCGLRSLSHLSELQLVIAYFEFVILIFYRLLYATSVLDTLGTLSSLHASQWRHHARNIGNFIAWLHWYVPRHTCMYHESTFGEQRQWPPRIPLRLIRDPILFPCWTFWRKHDVCARSMTRIDVLPNSAIKYWFALKLQSHMLQP